MAKDDKSAAPKAPVVHNNSARDSGPVGPSKCKFESCKKSPEKFGFCLEHYEWYMAGVIRGDGKKPLDFEEKFARYQQKSKKVA